MAVRDTLAARHPIPATLDRRTLGRRSFLYRVGGAAGVALAGTAIAADVPAPAAAAKVDGKALEVAFAEVFEKDFKVVGHRVATHEGPGTCCLIEAAPRREGFFVVRCDVRYPEHPDSDGRRLTWHVLVGPRGASRRNGFPLACVGDTVTFPVPANPFDLRHRFFREPFDHPRDVGEAENVERSDRKAAEADLPGAPAGWGDRPADRVEVESEVEESLALLKAAAVSGVSRTLSFVSHHLSGVFEARAPGRFNLLSAPEGEDLPPKAAALRVVSVQVVPKDAPLRVLATRLYRCQVGGRTGGFRDTDRLEPGTLVLRTGDRVALGLWSYKTVLKDRQSPRDVVHPKLKIRRVRFDAKPWPFDHRVVPGA